MSRITTQDGTQLYVKDWGEGRPVIMVHGWPLSADSFDDLSMSLVDAGLRAISYDRRGFGRSDQPASGYDYDTLADDLRAVIAHTGAKDVALLGFSMGGGEVARYMSRHGGKDVKETILISSILPYMLNTSDIDDRVDLTAFEAMTQSIKADRAHFWPGFFEKFFGVDMLAHPVSREVVEWARGMSMQAGLLPTLACAQSFTMTDFRADMASFTAPTLIIHGTADKIVPIDTSSRKAALMIAHARLVEYEGAPHGLFASHKDQIFADVLAFLQSPATLNPI